jgi:hypothetical protein
MKEVIEGLGRLDAIDRRLRELQRERAGLPEERARAEEAVKAVRKDLGDVEAEIQRSSLARKAAEGEIERNAEAIGRHEVQKNLVKTQREYDALNAEIGILRAKNAALSDAAFEEMDRSEELEVRRRALRTDLAGREEDRKKTEAELEARGRECEAAIGAVGEERKAAAALLPPAVLGRYEKIRSGKDGVALARIDRDACEVCYRSIPPQRIIEIKKLDKLVTCEGCGRILLCD